MPGEPKKEHHTTDAECHTHDSGGIDFFLLLSNSAPFVSNQHYDDPDKDKEVKEHYGQDGS